MKAAVNKITEQAKRRDTLGRNLVSVLVDRGHSGLMLFAEQQRISSDNVEKITNIILKDPTTGDVWLLKYRIMHVECGSGNALEIMKETSTMFEELSKVADDCKQEVSEQGGDLSDKECNR